MFVYVYRGGLESVYALQHIEEPIISVAFDIMVFQHNGCQMEFKVLHIRTVHLFNIIFSVLPPCALDAVRMHSSVFASGWMEILLLEAVFVDCRKIIEPKGVEIIIPRPSVGVHIRTRFHMSLYNGGEGYGISVVNRIHTYLVSGPFHQTHDRDFHAPLHTSVVFTSGSEATFVHLYISTKLHGGVLPSTYLSRYSTDISRQKQGTAY